MSNQKGPDLEKILQRLFLRKRAERALTKIEEIDQKLAFPSRSFRSIHIAGTNGKGTVALNIANALTKAGLKTGLFISPHVHTITERIQINGKMIEKAELSRLLDLIMDMTEDLHFFAVLTLAAFQYFREHDVDFAVIEAGVGGTLDPTNIIFPKLSLITNVTDDHKDLLGNTLGEIAAAKAGIIKPHIPAIVGHRAAKAAILKRAFHVKAPITILPPRSDFREENNLMVRIALKELSRGACADYQQCQVHLPCRFEERTFLGLPIIFDIAHNTDGLEKLFENVQKKYQDKPIFSVFNMSHTDYMKECTTIVKANSEKIYLYKMNHERLSPLEILKKHLPDAKMHNLDQFIQEAREQSGVLVVTGSAFIMHEIKSKLLDQEMQTTIK